jgi:hypothetical protein
LKRTRLAAIRSHPKVSIPWFRNILCGIQYEIILQTIGWPAESQDANVIVEKKMELPHSVRLQREGEET